MKGQKFQEKRCKAMVEDWADRLGISAWCLINVRFSTDIDGERITAECTPDWEYEQAGIKFNLPTCAVMSDERLEAAVVHELVHILTAPMEQKLRKRDALLGELSVEKITKAIIRAAK
jgi:hypothetical protein